MEQSLMYVGKWRNAYMKCNELKILQTSSIILNVTGFMKTVLIGKFCISRNTILKY